ncbi:MAG: hypothetical protein J7L53_07935 [Deltaproteobacteria bacterium]|nr:hypothetical protein [Deltaproteobacteria bacterium]
MSRPLRIEYEGVWYYVMNRGDSVTAASHRAYHQAEQKVSGLDIGVRYNPFKYPYGQVILGGVEFIEKELVSNVKT